MSHADLLADLHTPCLVLDEAIMRANIARMDARMSELGVTLRPHLKTVKSVDAARQVIRNGSAATVSTLREAEVFAASGVEEIFYAVGITPNKLPRILALRATGCDLIVALDSAEQARFVAEASRMAGDRIPALLEIDSDGHRAGLIPASDAVVEIGRILSDGGADLRGVFTHAGGSYEAGSEAALRTYADRERDAVVTAANRLREAGLPCPVVSVGSTPTASFATDLTGVTEARPGVYTLNDLVMAGLGVCGVEDIAISVLATVIGHQRERGWTLVDAGWMAMSRDRGTAAQPLDQGYGVVCDIDGTPIGDLVMIGANQEHGIVAPRPGATTAAPDLPVGTMLRILPNHACATAAQFDGYHVVQADGSGDLAYWPRFRGW
jgi:D-serine deaminase-like pyridoxal phosphate-dependent protein